MGWSWDLWLWVNGNSKARWVFSWKLSSFLIQVFDLKEAHKSCRSQAITHSVLSRAGHALEADPGDPKHSSVPFPMKVDFIL